MVGGDRLPEDDSPASLPAHSYEKKSPSFSLFKHQITLKKLTCLIIISDNVFGQEKHISVESEIQLFLKNDIIKQR